MLGWLEHSLVNGHRLGKDLEKEPQLVGELAVARAPERVPKWECVVAVSEVAVVFVESVVVDP
jgi:hypothetical protein